MATLLSLARFGQAFLLLRAHGTGLDPAYVPFVMILMHLVYALAAYPFGVMADLFDRDRQLVFGASVLVLADILLAAAASPSVVMIGAALWGLQYAVTQGLLAAMVADYAPSNLRGTAFGIFDLAIGAGSFVASAIGGVLWAVLSPEWMFGFSAATAGIVILILMVRR